MGKLVLVTGGARSGKSTFAEQLAAGFGKNVLYTATCVPFDDEMIERVKKHKSQRPPEWKTLEAYSSMDKLLPVHGKGMDCVLIDCLTIMMTNIILENHNDLDNISSADSDRLEKIVKKEVALLVKTAGELSIPVIIVTNETGMGVVPEYPSGRVFRDIGGRMNQLVAKAAVEVYFCVSGIPMRIK